MKILLSFLFALPFLVLAQNVQITGVAPAYIGQSIEVYEYKDYLSKLERIISTSTVQNDSTFELQFNTSKIKKVIIKSGNNRGFLFVQPNGNYSIFFPEKDKFDPYRPAGNNVEVAFFDLDSADINYKLLSFQRWVDNFVGNNFHKKGTDAKAFVESLDRFKSNVEKAYKNDTSYFFKTYVKFTIAGLDNIQHAAERNRYEKYDFYLKRNPTEYDNEAYMEYMLGFYQKLLPRLSTETNQAVYEGVLQSSPTLVMKALGGEYTLSNLRLRELVMIQSLSEEYVSGEFPETNIITILDSLGKRSLFKEHEEIAQNIQRRITLLNAGGKAPDFVLMQEGKATKTLFNYTNKHIYLHFFDPESEQIVKELPLLMELQQMYGKYVQFVSVYKEKTLSEKAQKQLQQVPWDLYSIPSSNSIWKNYAVESFPQYTLIDAVGYIVASPALGPTPNGQYQTIGETFYNLKKAWLKENERDDSEH